MTSTADGPDLFTRLEREVRSPKETLLVDAFLPPPEAIPSALRRPAAPRPVPEPAPAPSADPSPEPDFTAAAAGRAALRGPRRRDAGRRSWRR